MPPPPSGCVVSRLHQLLVVALVFTVIMPDDRPGTIYGELRMCFEYDAKTPTAAA